MDTVQLALEVRPLGPCAQAANKLLKPLMRWLMGDPRESPQRTHRWNNHHLRAYQVTHLSCDRMVAHEGNPASRTLPPPFLHLTRFGGWKHYVVLEPVDCAGEWHIGWRWPGGGGVSRLRNRGMARALIGPGPTEWFAIRASDGVQIPLRKVAEGRLGDGGPYSGVPLY